MDATTRSDIARQIATAKARIPGIAQDISDARRAGLGDVVKAQEETLANLTRFLNRLEEVYGK